MPKVLVADGEQDVVRLIESCLRKEGFQVVACDDGQTALKLADEEKPDLIILGIMMPLMDGMEVLRQIRSHRATFHIPAIVLAPRTGGAEVDEARELWISDYIVKPFDSEKLVASAKKALKITVEP